MVYWPVLSQDPLLADAGQIPVLDVMVAADGTPLRHVIRTGVSPDDNAMLGQVAGFLRFQPAVAAGNPTSGFYRFVVATYFHPEATGEEMVTRLPEPKFSMPGSLLEEMRTVAEPLGEGSLDILFQISSKGTVERMSGNSPAARKVVDQLLSARIGDMAFSPALLGDFPVETRLHLKVNLAELEQPHAHGFCISSLDRPGAHGFCQHFDEALLQDLELPVPLHVHAPYYPVSLRNEGISGYVTVVFEINENGTVMHPRIAQQTHWALGDSVLKAIRDWKFEPATVDGKPVTLTVSKDFPFTVELAGP